jgi:hypothetical protein
VPVSVIAPQSKLAASYRQFATKVSGGSEPDLAARATANGSRLTLRTIFTRKRS